MFIAKPILVIIGILLSTGLIVGSFYYGKQSQQTPEPIVSPSPLPSIKPSTTPSPSPTTSPKPTPTSTPTSTPSPTPSPTPIPTVRPLDDIRINQNVIKKIPPTLVTPTPTPTPAPININPNLIRKF